MADINKILKNLNIKGYTMYGSQIAKVSQQERGSKNGKLVLVTAISPTKSGNGKTTVSIGLADALCEHGTAILSLREPSLGPVFGLKGGATGGGASTIEPHDKINLHFTGDMHAITSANNLVCAALDNHIFFGNSLQINRQKVYISRCLDMNDRALRTVTLSSGRKESFVITAASEFMALLTLSSDFADLKQRVDKLVVAENMARQPVTIADLGITDAVCSLLVDAINPNLVATKCGTPALVHGGPFANIAHGASSVIATKMALSFADYCVTEAGFGADLGGEKFFDIVCPKLNKYPDCVVLIATISALKEHGNGSISAGMCNLKKHLDNLKNLFGANVVVTINKFAEDIDSELNEAVALCQNLGAEVCICDCFAQGKSGAAELAAMVAKTCQKRNACKSLQKNDSNILQKIEDIATLVYGAGKVELSKEAQEQYNLLKEWNLANLPVVIAKTQYSFSTDDKLLGAPTGHILQVSQLQPRCGAGFIVAVCGKMLLMPGLPSTPNAQKIRLSGTKITSLL